VPDCPGEPRAQSDMASFRASRASCLNESSVASLQLPLLFSPPDDCDGSVYSDDLDEEKLGSSLPSKSSFRISQGPVTESFPASPSARRAIPNLWRRLPTFLSHASKPRWSCSSTSGTHGPILGFETTFSKRPKPVRRLICICLGILVMLFVGTICPLYTSEC